MKPGPNRGTSREISTGLALAPPGRRPSSRLQSGSAASLGGEAPFRAPVGAGFACARGLRGYPARVPRDRPSPASIRSPARPPAALRLGRSPWPAPSPAVSNRTDAKLFRKSNIAQSIHREVN